uniref:Copia protein n=1 Tax=Tanacetum cinerariifolium TaxID=118510 RepID=A0A6L2JEY5_TANCI|nr:copia protein [Tanacetum cinerariifolium]
MSGELLAILSPFGVSSGNPDSTNANRVDTMPTTTNPINTTTMTNVAQSVVDENLPQLLDSRGGSYVRNVLAFDKENFISWNVRFLVFLDGLEPYLLKTLEDGPFVPMSKDEGTSKNREFMAIVEDEPFVGKADARFRQWVDITMKKPVTFKNLCPLLPMLTKADPSSVSKSLISLSDLTANLADLTLNTTSKEINKSSNKVSQTYVIKKKNKSKHLFVQNSYHEKNDIPSTRNLCPLLLMLTEADPSSVSKSLISLSDLTTNLADLTLNTTSKDINKYSNKVSWTYVIKKKTKSKHLAVQNSFPKKNALPSIRQLLLTLMEEVKASVSYVMMTSKFYLQRLLNKNDEVVLIAPRKRDVYVIDMSSFNEESNTCFLAKASQRVFKNKMDEEGVVTKNKAKLVPKGYRQEKGIDYDETFAPVGRLEAIRIFLACASYMGFIVYQMDMRSAFLNGKIFEKVYVEQPPRYQAIPKESYLVVVKRIFRYLKGTPNLGLCNPKGSCFDLKAYSDSDYVGCNLDRKGTFRGCQILGGKSFGTKTITFLLSWKDKPLSFTQDEFIFAIGLPICKDTVPIPPNETVRAALAALAKLFEKHEQILLPSSGEVNADDTADKSLSSATHANVTKPTVDAPKGLAFDSAEEQGNQPSIAKAKKVLEQNVEESKDDEFVSMEEVAEEQSKEILTVE